MKTFFLLYLIMASSFASITFEDELTYRLKLYGLSTPKEAISIKTRKYDTRIIESLQKNIKEEYIPYLQSYSGTCHQENCIKEHSQEFKTLETEHGSICLPYTQCGFYKCMENKYRCHPAGVHYFTELAYPTCQTYLKNIQKQKFTQKGYEWIYSVMVCLQKGLIDECEIKNNCKKETNKKTCDYITKFTLEFHPGCYINSGVGVCNLPLSDKINIWRTVGKFLTKDEFKQAVETVKHCIRLERGMIH